MSEFQKLLNSIDQKRGLCEPPLDLNSLLLPIQDIVANIIALENPNLSREDIELMIYGFANSLNQNISPTAIQQQMNNLRNDAETLIGKLSIQSAINEVIETPSLYPLGLESSYYLKAYELIDKIKFDVEILIRKVRELITEVGLATGILTTVLPGSLLMLMPLSFNIPGMISTLLHATITVSNVISKYKEVVCYLDNFKTLYLVFAEENLEKISKMINNLVNSVREPFEALGDLFSKFNKDSLDKISEETTEEKETKRKKQVARRLKKLKYLPDMNIDKVEDDDKDEVNSILDQWNIKNGRPERKESLDELKNILGKLKDNQKEFDEILNATNRVPKYIYNLKFDTGKILYNLTEEEIKSYEKIYEIIYTDEVEFKL